ncbi:MULTISPECIES: hypothetical protein [unclassified Arcicella]|nr:MULTISPECIES: hypothetical protein [unclassified Arcicella]MDR6563198.1 hypothetical protein [Arcicella sp. BE51]MDR6811651.1 hypothetical protein [Arcicella sp. BE140]MDR6823176.1 hypothetical protein [Arcicella sp. BE139]
MNASDKAYRLLKEVSKEDGSMKDLVNRIAQRYKRKPPKKGGKGDAPV